MPTQSRRGSQRRRATSFRNRRRPRRGGSNASDNVEALSPTVCGNGTYPAPIQDVMLFEGESLGAAAKTKVLGGHKIQAGGGNDATRTSWFAQHFLPYVMEQIDAGVDAMHIVKNMVRAWNKHNTTKKQRLTEKTATRMLYDFASTNRQNRGGRMLVPTTWPRASSVARTASRRRPRGHHRRHQRRQGGGGEYDMASAPAPTPNNALAACPTNTTSLPYNYDNYYRFRGNNGNSAVFGASIPKNIGQRVQNWFNGQSTLFQPAFTDIMHQNKAQLSCVGTSCDVTTLPTLANATESIPAPHGIQLTGRLFDVDNDPITFENYDTPHQRAGGAPRRRRRTGRTPSTQRRSRRQ